MKRRRESTRPPADPEPEVFLPLPHLPFHVLLALSGGARHGWGVIRAIEGFGDGTRVPSSGSLYVAMSRLEERGLIEKAPAPDEADARRKYVRLSSLGRRVLAAETARLAALVELSRRSVDPRSP